MGINMPNFLEVDFKDWIRVIDTNIGWNFMFCRQAAKHMLQLGGGAIVVIGSVNGIRTYQEPQCILHLQVRPARFSPQPGCGAWPLPHPCQYGGGRRHQDGAVLCTPGDPELAAQQNPLGDIAEFQDIANAAYFLADNEQARIITGAELAVDGGSLAQFVYEEEGIKLSDGTVIAD